MRGLVLDKEQVVVHALDGFGQAASLRLPAPPVERLEEDMDAVGYDLIFTMDNSQASGDAEPRPC